MRESLTDFARTKGKPGCCRCSDALPDEEEKCSKEGAEPDRIEASAAFADRTEPGGDE